MNLDRMPLDESEVADFHQCLLNCEQGLMTNGWGEVTQWPAERMVAGDWTPAIWRSPELAQAAWEFANHPDLQELESPAGRLRVHATGRQLRGSFERAVAGAPGSFPILKSKGAEGQTTIRSTPDEHWVLKKRQDEVCRLTDSVYPGARQILQKAGHLLITAGQNNSSARLAATASDERYVGNGWMPITGLSPAEAKALAVFINSTAGRLQLMQNPGKTLAFPTYSAKEAGNIGIPDISDCQIQSTLAECWESTRSMEVPQFRDGECQVRVLWDNAVAEAMNWDSEEMAYLRQLLHKEPHVRGLGYGQYADEPEEDDDASDENVE